MASIKIKQKLDFADLTAISRPRSIAFILLAVYIVNAAGTAFGQQTGQLPSNTSNNNSKKNETKSSTAASLSSTSSGSSSSSSSLANSNNYASSISLLTSNLNKPISSYVDSSEKANSRSGLFNFDPLTPLSTSHQYGYQSKLQSSGQYSPYLMPVSNYYTGSSSSSSSSSPYQYTHYYTQAETSNKAQHVSPSSTVNSIKDKLMKSASTTKSINITGNSGSDELTPQERLQRQLQLALLYNQLMAMQQYRSMYGSSGSGGSGYNYPYSYPNSISSLYNYYGANALMNQDDSSASSSPGTSSSNNLQVSTESSTATDSQLTSATNNQASTSASNEAAAAAAAAQLQALASMIAYRQQLSNLYGGMYGSGGGGYGGYGGVSSLYGGHGGGHGYGYPSSLFGSSGMGGSYSSLLGSAMPIGGNGGMFSNLAGGLSSLTGSGLGVLGTLGMLFG